MKRSILTLLSQILLFAAMQAQIVITEIMYNPPPSGTDTLEYVEIYNNSTSTVDISGWSFSQGFVYVFPAGSTMAPNTYLVISENAAYFQERFGFAPIQWTDGALTNGGEDLELVDANGAVIDYVDYKNAAPWPIEPNGSGPSLVLCDPNADNSLPISWQPATTITNIVIGGTTVVANPGAAAGCTGVVVINAINDAAVAGSGIAVTVNVLTNDLLPNPLTTITVVNQPDHGTATVNGDNSITYTSANAYCGVDTLTYRICDANGCDDATIAFNVKCYTSSSLESLSADDAEGIPTLVNNSVEVSGVVYGVNLRPLAGSSPSLLFTIMDNAGNFGISISSVLSNLGYTVKEKDILTIKGTVINVSGLATVQADFITKTGEAPQLAPADAVVNHSENTESELITMNNVRLVDNAEWTTGVGTSGFNVRAVSDNQPTDTILIRIDRDVETYNAPVPAQPFKLTGLGGQFDSSSPFTSGYQVLPRYDNDISTLSSATQITDFSAHVRVMPNPVSDFAVIQTNVSFDRMTLYSLSGQKMFEVKKPSDEELIPMRLLPAGTYALRVEKGNAYWSTQIVKQ